MAQEHAGPATVGENDQVSVYIPPKNDVDNELHKVPTDAHPKSAYVRLRYDWSAEKAIDPQRWQPHLLVFSQTDFYTEVLEDIEEYIHSKLKRLEPETCDRLDRGKSYIVLQLTIENEDALKRHACTFDASGTSRLRYFRDLYETNVRPALGMLLRAVESHGKYQENGRLVEIRTRDDVLPHVEHFSIGSVSEPIVESNGEGDAGTLQQPLLIKILRRFFWKCTSDAVQPPVIVQVPAWQRGTPRICDIDDESAVDMALALPEHFRWEEECKRLMQSEQADSFQSFLDALRSRRDDSKPTPYNFARKSRVTYTFWDVSLDRPDVPSFPEGIIKDVSAVVRFVQHLEPNNNTTFNFIHNQ